MILNIKLRNNDECRGCPCIRCVGIGYICNLYQDWLKVDSAKQITEDLIIVRLEKCKEENE